MPIGKMGQKMRKVKRKERRRDGQQDGRDTVGKDNNTKGRTTQRGFMREANGRKEGNAKAELDWRERG